MILEEFPLLQILGSHFQFEDAIFLFSNESQKP